MAVLLQGAFRMWPLRRKWRQYRWAVPRIQVCATRVPVCRCGALVVCDALLLPL